MISKGVGELQHLLKGLSADNHCNIDKNIVFR